MDFAPKDFHKNFIRDPPQDCVLAAIRDEDARRGAQYAIPNGKIAITQGYFPIDDYEEGCIVKDDKTLNGTVSGCHEVYWSYFKNFEDTDVVDDKECWDQTIDYHNIPDGLVWAAIGADGLLRPVLQWSDMVYDPEVEDPPQEMYGYTG